MLPIVQFDPASLAIFAEGPTMAADDKVADLIAATIRGDFQAVSDGFQVLAGRRNVGRALQLTSAFLHEKRHFHDFISTNYGAFRFRQFQELYANLRPILAAGRSMGQLALPIEVNLDPIRRRVLGIGAAPPELLAVAEGLKKRRRMIEHDRQPYSSRFGTFEIGGEAQLEALAYAAQSRFVMSFGGAQAHDEFEAHVFDRMQFMAKYSAFVNMGLAAGLVPIRKVDKIEGRPDNITQRIHADLALLECIIFAALQSDYVPYRRSLPNQVIESSYPADRFAALAIHLTQEHKSLCETTTGLHWGECWEVVDAACAKVFGFRVYEQVARDIENCETHLAQYREAEDEILIAISEDFLALRKEMCDRLERTPARVVSTENFALSVGAEVNPLFVMATSRGELGDPPEGFVRLMAYDTSEESGKTRPWRKWWWAAAADEGTFASQPGALRPHRPQYWYPVIDGYAPLAKLILNGRKVRTLIGPELVFAEMRINRLGLRFRYFPGFEFPDEEIPEAVLRFIRPPGDLICDYTNKAIPLNEATILTPWTLRRYPDLAQHTIRHMGGDDLAYHFFIKDWSHWVVSRQVMKELRPLMQRQLPDGIQEET